VVILRDEQSLRTDVYSFEQVSHAIEARKAQQSAETKPEDRIRTCGASSRGKTRKKSTSHCATGEADLSLGADQFVDDSTEFLWLFVRPRRSS
jgi:hypothetical protein